ncbi:MAG TPA: hypothetical protein VFM55_15450 [Micromonosporaceae bacterium]|nr:hypothetical protein [Micromonosporaceae bacterium]
MGRSVLAGVENVALGRSRGARWLADPPLATVEEAARYLDRVGFALLFPADRVNAPSLWEAVAGGPAAVAWPGTAG